MNPNDVLTADLIWDSTYRRGGKIELFDSIDACATALIVIDMQDAWLAEGGAFETPPARAIVPGINRLAQVLRAAGGMVIWIQHTTAAPGEPGFWGTYFDVFIAPENREHAATMLTEGAPMWRLAETLDVQEEDMVLTKFRFSVFARNPVDVEAMLRERGIDTLIVTGTATNMCVESTVRDAMMRDFNVFMPYDLVAAPKIEAHRAGLRSVMQGFADVRGEAAVVALIDAG